MVAVHALLYRRLYSGYFSKTATASKARLNCQNNLPTARFWSLFMFGFHFTLIFWLCCLFTYYTKHFLSIKNSVESMLNPTKKILFHITFLPFYNGDLSTTATFLCPQGDRCGQARSYRRPHRLIVIIEVYSFAQFLFAVILSNTRNNDHRANKIIIRSLLKVLQSY